MHFLKIERQVEIQAFFPEQPVFYLPWFGDLTQDGISVFFLAAGKQNYLIYLTHLGQKQLSSWPLSAINFDLLASLLERDCKVVVL